MKTPTIWFHGTSASAAKKILRNGFRDGTYFAAHLEDALAFGGNFVFLVVLPFSPIELAQSKGWRDAWQVKTSATITQIVRLTKYTQTVRCEYADRLDRIFDANAVRGASLNPIAKSQAA